MFLHTLGRKLPTHHQPKPIHAYASVKIGAQTRFYLAYQGSTCPLYE